MQMEQPSDAQVGPSTSKAHISSSALQALDLHQSKNPLFNKINNTATPMGSRQLRSELVSPPIDINFINRRLDFVEKYRTSPWITHIHKCLLHFPDISRLSSLLRPIIDTNIPLHLPAFEHFNILTGSYKSTKLSQHHKYIRAVKDLFSFYSAMTALQTILHESQLTNSIISQLLTLINSPEWNTFTQLITYQTNPEFINIKQSIFDCDVYLLADNIDDCLDLARIIYKRNVSECQELLISLTSTFNVNIHTDLYYGRVLITTDLKPDLIPLRTTKRGIVCTTKELQNANYRLKETYDQIIELSGNICTVLISKLTKPIHQLLINFELLISELDLLISNTISSKQSNYVRPTFSNSMFISSLMHPLIVNGMPNNYYIGPSMPFCIVTGENTSGKSTYTKSAIYTNIISQIGLFINAESVQLIIASNIEFIKSIEDVKRIVNSRHLNRPTHVLIDELECQTAVQIALAEWLISQDILCYYTTHRSIIIKYIKGNKKINIIRINKHMAESGMNESINAIKMYEDSLNKEVVEKIKEYYGMLVPIKIEHKKGAAHMAAIIKEGSEEIKKKLKEKLSKVKN